ncbi:hypothetical protein ACOMHN_058148 [Nucella lapillus]
MLARGVNNDYWVCWRGASTTTTGSGGKGRQQRLLGLVTRGVNNDYWVCWRGASTTTTGSVGKGRQQRLLGLLS